MIFFNRGSGSTAGDDSTARNEKTAGDDSTSGEDSSDQPSDPDYGRSRGREIGLSGSNGGGRGQRSVRGG